MADQDIQQLETLQLQHNPVPPPRHLLDRILSRLGLEKKITITRKHLVVASLMLIGAVIVGSLASIALHHEVRSSEFRPIALLLFSDTRHVATYGHDFAFAVAESLPVMHAGFFLGSLALVLLGIRVVVQYADTLKKLLQSITK